MNKHFSKNNNASSSTTSNIKHNMKEKVNVGHNKKQNTSHEQSKTHEAKYLNTGSKGKGVIVKKYFQKMKGEKKSPPRRSVAEMIWSWCGIFLSMYVIFYLDSNFRNITSEYPLVFASIGASAVLIFALPESPYSQPRAVIGGHFFSAIAGITAYKFFHIDPIVVVALAVSSASLLMTITNTLHPPGGATALLAVIGADSVQELGYWFAITPCVTSATILVILGVFLNNLSKMRKYPSFWW